MLKSNQLYQGDCLELLPQIDTDSVDLIVTSPPYNCGIEYDVYNDSIDWDDYMAWVVRWLVECYRVLKPDGRMCLNVLCDMTTEGGSKRVSPFAEYYSIVRDIGFGVAGFPVWADSHRKKYTAWGSWLSPVAPYIYMPYDMIMILYKDSWRKFEKGVSTIQQDDFIRGCSGVWDISPESQQRTKANFPVALAKLCIELLSFEGDLVLDPFGGSGTTAVACVQTKRRYILMELSRQYHQVAAERVLDSVPPMTFLEMRGRI